MSAVAISGLAHCESYSPKEETKNEPHPLAVPSHKVHIRVRVGRYRDGQQATVNGGQVRVVGGELQTTTEIRGLFDKADSEHFLSKAPTQFTIGSGEKQKVVTADLHMHARSDIGRGDFDIVTHVPVSYTHLTLPTICSV